jgi:hypothetical protein
MSRCNNRASALRRPGSSIDAHLAEASFRTRRPDYRGSRRAWRSASAVWRSCDGFDERSRKSSEAACRAYQTAMSRTLVEWRWPNRFGLQPASRRGGRLATAYARPIRAQPCSLRQSVASRGHTSTTPCATAHGTPDTIRTASSRLTASMIAKPAVGSGDERKAPSVVVTPHASGLRTCTGLPASV